MLHRVDITHDVRALTLVPGGEFLLSGSYRDKTLKLWNLRNGRFVEEFHFDQGVEAIACSSNIWDGLCRLRRWSGLLSAFQ